MALVCSLNDNVFPVLKTSAPSADGIQAYVKMVDCPLWGMVSTANSLIEPRRGALIFAS